MGQSGSFALPVVDRRSCRHSH